jgi:hypothetical protein
VTHHDHDPHDDSGIDLSALLTFSVGVCAWLLAMGFLLSMCLHLQDQTCVGLFLTGFAFALAWVIRKGMR